MGSTCIGILGTSSGPGALGDEVDGASSMPMKVSSADEVVSPKTKKRPGTRPIVVRWSPFWSFWSSMRIGVMFATFFSFMLCSKVAGQLSWEQLYLAFGISLICML